jgi:hypothetical protein
MEEEKLLFFLFIEFNQSKVPLEKNFWIKKDNVNN